MLGNTLRNADNEGDLGGDGLFDTGRGNGGTVGCAVSLGLQRRDLPSFGFNMGSFLRDEDGGRRGAGLLHTLCNIGKDGQAEMCLASLLGICASNNLCP